MINRIHLKKILWIYVLAFILTAFSFHAKAEDKAEAPADKSKVEKAEGKDKKAEKADKKADKKAKSKKDDAGKDLFAVFETNKGTFKVKLRPDKAPNTVANFVGLAEGTKEWTDPKTGKKVKKPFYDGLIFHRVIPNFMLQGGDPLGNGSSGPGFTIDDEIHTDYLKHDKPGILSMAKTERPNTGGSQFFVTVAATPWLDGKHTAFGEVVEGMDVVDNISKLPTAPGDRPLEDVVMKHVKIERK